MCRTTLFCGETEVQDKSSLNVFGLTLFLAFSLTACATIPSSGVRYETNRAELTDDFKNGNARLGCGVNCAATFAYNRSTLKRYYDQDLWNDLAVNVLGIGYGSDISYFYLGRAAEGLGYITAADTYYRLSLASELKCVVVVDVCEGFAFPRDAESRLADILKVKEEKIRQAKQEQQRNCNRAYGDYFEKAQSTSDGEKAIALYRAGLALCPDDDVAHYELGKTLANHRRYAEAERELEIALKLNPDFLDAKRQLEVVRKNRK
jgi:tetratricopeptide (TPR) repeat protein